MIELREFNGLDGLAPQTCQNVLRLLGEDVQVTIAEQLTVRGLFYLDPFSWVSHLWSAVYLLVFYIIQLQISFTIAFGPTFLNNELQIPVYRFLVISLYTAILVDIIISMHRGFYAFGKAAVVKDFKQILKRYATRQLPIDIICFVILSVSLFERGYALNYVQLVPGVLMWIKKSNYQARLVKALKYYRTARISLIIGLLFIDVLMVGNYGACIFVGIDLLLWRLQYYGSNTAYYWLSNNSSYSVDLMGGPWYLQYIYAQSFSTGTLSTLAPGPFAKNPIEVVRQQIVLI